MKDSTSSTITKPPRTIGALSMQMAGKNSLRDLYQQGASRMLFAKQRDGAAHGIFINTSGGLTSGDCLDTSIVLKNNVDFTFSTQGCERIYRSASDASAEVHNHVRVQDEAFLNWLPQETIFYDGACLNRQSVFDIASSSSALIVESLLFGRLAMGESYLFGHLNDQITLRIDDETIFKDVTNLDGDISAQLERPAIMAGARATALVLYSSNYAWKKLGHIREFLNATSGASLVQEQLIVGRLIADTGKDLRQMLAPIIRELASNDIPKTWRL